MILATSRNSFLTASLVKPHLLRVAEPEGLERRARVLDVGDALAQLRVELLRTRGQRVEIVGRIGRTNEIGHGGRRRS